MITGSRNWTARGVMRKALEQVRDEGYELMIVGDATGADFMAEDLWLEWELSTTTFIADWKRYGKYAGSLRNQQMIDAGPELVLAFPRPASRGTFDAIRRARSKDIPVRVFRQKEDQWPDLD
jgi:hypothetical protein